MSKGLERRSEHYTYPHNIKTLADLECDYLEALPLSDRCAYLVTNYGQDIVNDPDWFYYCADFVINIHDYDEDGIYSAVAYPFGKDGLVDYSTIIEITTYSEKELLA